MIVYILCLVAAIVTPFTCIFNLIKAIRLAVKDENYFDAAVFAALSLAAALFAYGFLSTYSFAVNA